MTTIAMWTMTAINYFAAIFYVLLLTTMICDVIEDILDSRGKRPL
jgi:hypothetical protein